MSSHSIFTMTEDTKITTVELSLFVQADHSYSLPVISDIKEEEYKIDDDLKVVEITEEVDVSMHFEENGTAYLQDANGVQWNLENPDSFRLDELSWKPLGVIVKTEQDIVKAEQDIVKAEQDIVKSEPQDEYVDSVKLVKNCVKCKAFLSSGALCVKCNQPWVALTDICKTKDSEEKKMIVKDNKMENESDTKQKKFYVLKKSDVETFVNKNMGKLSVINQYVAGNVSNVNLNVVTNDVSRKSDSDRTYVTNEINTTKQNIFEQKKDDISERNRVSDTKSSNSMQVRTPKPNILKKTVNKTDKTSDIKQIDIEQRINDIIESNKKTLNARSEKYIKVGTSKRSILKKIVVETGKVVKKRFPQQKEFDSKFSFIQKLVTVDIDPLKQNNSSRKEPEEQNVDAGEKSMENIKITDVNQTHRSRNVNTCPKVLLMNQIKQNDVTGKDHVQKVSVMKSYGKRKSALNHKFLKKKSRDIEEDTLQPNDSEEEKIVTENDKSVMENKPKRHLTSKRFLCVACDETFFEYNNLYEHMEKHNPPFGCTQCKVKLLSETELKAHSVVHNVVATREFKCRLCEKEVKNLNMLRIHSYTHVKNKKFPCDKCDKSFCNTTQLKFHMIKHGTLPYSCELCQRQFKRCGYLRRHYCPKRWNTEEIKNENQSSHV